MQVGSGSGSSGSQDSSRVEGLASSGRGPERISLTLATGPTE